MPDPISYGSLVAYKNNPQDGLQVLLAKRPFLDPLTAVPCEFPGECMFPGGKFQKSDYVSNQPSLLRTAVRHFRAQLNYFGSIIEPSYLPQKEDTVYGELRLYHFFAAQVPDFADASNAPRSGFGLPYRWMTPASALEFILSPQFAEQQERAFQERQLDDASFYGSAAITTRVVSSATRNILDYLSGKPKFLPVSLGEGSESI